MKRFVTTTLFIVLFTSLYAQVAVPFLQIPHDARHSAMGNTGAATYADASANFYNPAKLAFTDRYVGGNITRFSWLKSLVDGMYATNISAYYRPKKSSNQAFGIYYSSLNQGTINFTSATGQPDGSFSSLDQALGLTYAKKISKNISLGMGLKYIDSQLSGIINVISNNSIKTGKTIAADISLFGQAGDQENFKFNYGLALSNIGGKISYGRGAYSLPTNIRAGIAPTFQRNKNRFLVGFDVNKNFYGEPFTKLVYSVGTEYSYNNYFFGRMGYYYDPKGNVKYFTMGLGGRIMKQIGLDFAYRVGNNANFNDTAQLSLVFDFKSFDKSIISSL